MVDATPATEAELQNELDKVQFNWVEVENISYFNFQVAKAYGGGAGVDMTAFPELTFGEPIIDPINISSAQIIFICKTCFNNCQSSLESC